MFPMPGNSSFEWNGYLLSVSQKRLNSKRTIVVGGSKVVGRGFRYNYGYDFEDPFLVSKLWYMIENIINGAGQTTARPIQCKINLMLSK
jgi:hypothetical protein